MKANELKWKIMKNSMRRRLCLLSNSILALALVSCAERSAVSQSLATTGGSAGRQGTGQHAGDDAPAGRQRSQDQKAVSTPAEGRTVFLKNCAHCHGIDGRGDEGPDLHNLDESDAWIANRIRNGKKGQMTPFAGKLKEEEISEVIGYLRTLK